MFKVVVGGGGKGMWIICNVEEMEVKFVVVQDEVWVFFNDDQMYLEQYLVYLCYIEVQVIGDQYGNVLVLGEWDCMIQVCYQKVIEEVLVVVLLVLVCEVMLV